MTSRLNANAVPTRKRPSRFSFLSTAYAHVNARLGDLNVAEAAKVFFSKEVRAINGPRFFNELKTNIKNRANFGSGEPKLTRSSMFMANRRPSCRRVLCPRFCPCALP